MKIKYPVLLCLAASTIFAFAQSFSKVALVENVLLEEQSSDNCTVTFRLTNSNSYIVNIKYKTTTYADNGQSFPDSGSLYLNPGQSDNTVREYGAFTKCHVTKVYGEMAVTQQK
jgi:hypothetical protein